MSDQLSCAHGSYRHRGSGKDHRITDTPLILIDGIRPIVDNLWLVHDLLPAGGLSVLYGQPGSGKSLLALDLGFSVAAGCDWFGRKVNQGGVIYASGEGRIGVKNRLYALKKNRRKAGLRAGPYTLYPETINLFDPEDDVDNLIAWCRAFEDDREEPVVLIIIDTLADSLAGGDENSGKDMGLLLRRAQQIQRKTRAHVMLVHHTGKDGGGARGHSSLKAKADTMIKVEKGAARVEKQKDGPLGAPLQFGIRPVFIAQTDEGDKVFSAVIDPAEANAKTDSKNVHLTPQERQAYDLLCAIIDKEGVAPPAEAGAPADARAVTDQQWREVCSTSKVVTSRSGKQNPKSIKASFHRVKKKLIDKGLIVSTKGSGYVWLASESNNKGEREDAA